MAPQPSAGSELNPDVVDKTTDNESSSSPKAFDRQSSSLAASIPDAAASSKPISFDGLLELAGECGVYQVTLMLLIGAMDLVAIDSFSINFIAGKMDHVCRVPELDNRSFVEQRHLAAPPDAASESGFSRCFRYENAAAMADDALRHNATAFETTMLDGGGTTHARGVMSCDAGWTYERSVFISTIVSEWDLVCDSAWLVDLVSTVYMIGRLVACISCGSIADRFGRKPTVIAFHGLKLIGSVLSIYAPNYVVFAFSRFLIAVGSTASNLATFVIMSEICGVRYRSTFGIGWSLMVAFGAVSLPGIAYMVRSWRVFQSILTWPQFLLLVYIFVLDESPRWLLAKRRVKEAMQLMKKVAAINGRKLPNDVIPEVPLLPTRGSGDRRTRLKDLSIIKLVSTPNLRKRSLILWLNWCTSSLMYYALSLNAGSLPGDIFINMLFLSAVEIPANLLAVPLLERLGRRPTLGLSMLMAGASSLLMIPFMFIDGGDTGVVTFGVLGKAFITVAYSSAYVVTSETYPTDIRAVGMGVSTSFARFSSLFGSFVGGILSQKWRPLPPVIFAVLGFVSGGLAFLLPETRNRNMPQTVEEAENFNSNDDYEMTSTAVGQGKDAEASVFLSGTVNVKDSPSETKEVPLLVEKEAA